MLIRVLLAVKMAETDSNPVTIKRGVLTTEVPEMAVKMAVTIKTKGVIQMAIEVVTTRAAEETMKVLVPAKNVSWIFDPRGPHEMCFLDTF